MRNYFIGLVLGFVIGFYWPENFEFESVTIEKKVQVNDVPTNHNITVQSYFKDAVRYRVKFVVLSPTKELSRKNKRVILELENDIRFLGSSFESDYYTNFTISMREYIQMKISYTDMKVIMIIWEKEKIVKKQKFS